MHTTADEQGAPNVKETLHVEIDTHCRDPGLNETEPHFGGLRRDPGGLRQAAAHQDLRGSDVVQRSTLVFHCTPSEARQRW